MNGAEKSRNNQCASVKCKHLSLTSVKCLQFIFNTCTFNNFTSKLLKGSASSNQVLRFKRMPSYTEIQWYIASSGCNSARKWLRGTIVAGFFESCFMYWYMGKRIHRIYFDYLRQTLYEAFGAHKDGAQDTDS